MKTKLVIIVTLPILIASASLTLASDTPQTLVKLDLSKDLITFLKFAIWCGGIFITILAGIGVTFFGFDVRKARTSISEMTTELRNLINSSIEEHKKLKSVQTELEELKIKFEITASDAERKIEELGAQMEEMSNEATEKQLPNQTKRTDNELIQDIINNSKFKWTTIGRIRKKTGLSNEDILNRTRRMKNIEISVGKNTQEHIFKIVENS